MKRLRALCLYVAVAASGVVVYGGSLAGRVTSTTGTALANVFIDLYDQNGDYFDFTATDTLGNYHFSNLGQGGFYVHTDTLGVYAEEWFDNVPGASDDAFFDPLEAGATLVSVAYYASVTGINVSLERAGTIAGRVTGPTGAPLTNVYVDAYVPAGNRFLSDLTDSNGIYRLAGLPAGSYAVRTDSLGACVDKWHNQAVAFDSVTAAAAGVPSLAVTAGGLLTNVNIQLGVAAEIRGTLRSGTGSPVSGAYVDLFGPDGTHLEFDRSDTNGVYMLKGLPAGGYYLGTDTLGSFVELWYQQKPIVSPGQPALDGADLVNLSTGQVVSGRDFSFTVGAGISGSVVTTGGQAIADAFVDVYRGTNFFDYGLTDTAGVFRVTALPDGVYYVKVDTLGRYLDEWHEDAVVMDIDDPAGDGASPITLTNGLSVTGLVFRLNVGGEISGRISDILDQAIADAYVDLYTGAGRRLLYTKSATNGHYRLGGLPPGTYYLRADTVGRYADEWYDNRPVISPTNGAADGAQPIVTSLGFVLTNANLQLRRGGSISGSVSGTNAAPQPGTVVHLFYGTRQLATGTTGTNGAYSVGSLPAGTYYLRTDNVTGMLDEWYQNVYIYDEDAPVGDGATPLTLTDDQNRTAVNFALGYGSVITGCVQTAQGVAVAGAVVDLFDAQGRFHDTVVSLGDGSFRFEMVPPGIWYVGTDTLGLYADEWFNSIPRIDFMDPAEDGAMPLATVEGGIAAMSFLLDPAPPQPVALTLAVVDGTSPLIEWQGRTNRTYQVERTESLELGGWVAAPSGGTEVESSFKPAGADGLRQYRDPSPAGRAAYRVRSL